MEPKDIPKRQEALIQQLQGTQYYKDCQTESKQFGPNARDLIGQAIEQGNLLRLETVVARALKIAQRAPSLYYPLIVKVVDVQKLLDSNKDLLNYLKTHGDPRDPRDKRYFERLNKLIDEIRASQYFKKYHSIEDDELYNTKDALVRAIVDRDINNIVFYVTRFSRELRSPEYDYNEYKELKSLIQGLIRILNRYKDVVNASKF